MSERQKARASLSKPAGGSLKHTFLVVHLWLVEAAASIVLTNRLLASSSSESSSSSSKRLLIGVGVGGVGVGVGVRVGVGVGVRVGVGVGLGVQVVVVLYAVHSHFWGGYTFTIWRKGDSARR